MDPITTEAQAPAEAPAAQPVATPTNAPLPDSEALLEAMLYGGNAEVPAETTPAEAPAESPQPEVPADPVVESPDAMPETTSEPAETEEVELNKGKRYRFTDPQDQAFAALRKAGVPAHEATLRAYGDPAKADVPAVQERAQPSQVDSLAQSLVEIDAALDEAGLAEGLFTPEIANLIKKRGDISGRLNAERALSDRDAQFHQSRQQSEFNAARDAVKAEATAMFPAIATKGSDLHSEALRLMAEWGNPNHPDHALLTSRESPQIVAAKAATNVALRNSKANGTAFAAEYSKLLATQEPPAAALKPGTQEPAQRRIASPAPGAAATRTPDQPKPESQLLNEAQSEQDINALLYGGNARQVVYT